MKWSAIVAMLWTSVFASLTLATPQPIDATGLWIKPDESGWGASIYHQGDTLFASLFVYGPDGKPKWYTASAMTGGPASYSGALVEATGPYFGAMSFDPAAVARRVVGTMTMVLDDNGADLRYSVDGTQVSKRVTRFSMRPIDLNGYSIGSVVQPAEVSGAERLVSKQEIDVYDTSKLFDIRIFSNTGERYCEYGGATRAQDGGSVSVSGLSGCGYPTTMATPWSMKVSPTAHGFTGSFSDGSIPRGRIAGAPHALAKLQGVGWLDDLWFPPGEAGWGLNLVEQGDTAFATLFVYDSQNRPKWYSASQLKAGYQGFRPSWSGALEETTGPYFGAPFDAAAVTRRVVGSLSLQVTESGEALVTYTADGVTAVKRLSRFAFRANNLSGRYDGGIAELEPGTGPFGAQFTVDDGGDRVSLSMDIVNVSTILVKRHCEFTGASTQYGAQRSIAGTFSCADGAQGNFRMDDVLVTAEGLTGSYAGPSADRIITSGNIAGARR